jgi:hypothetical protein
MSAAVLEYELGTQGMAHEGELESEQFFGALANLAKRGAGWLTTAGSPQRRFALWAARQALSRGLPALGRYVGGRVGGDGAAGASLGTQAASWLGGLLPQQEFEAELDRELEISPIRRIYPDAMMEHLGHAAAETHSEAEAEALAGAMIPLAARSVPAAAPVILRAAPGLVCALSGVVQTLRRSPSTRPLVRLTPAIVRATAGSLARQAAAGAAVSPQAAVRTLARQTAQVLGSSSQASQAFRRSQKLDRAFHQTGGRTIGCPTCGCRAAAR